MNGAPGARSGGPSDPSNDDSRSSLEALGEAIGEALLVDRRRLQRRLRRLRREQRRGNAAQAQATARRVHALTDDIERSRAVVAARRRSAPTLEFPPELPVSRHTGELEQLIARHQVVIVTGATGSGKSTQLPKLCLAAGRGIYGRIGHTQPRRIAARAIAARIAAETATAPGTLAGHCVRFDDNLAAATRVKLMTDGILLNEIQRDRWLEQYDTLIVDEAHERSLNIDVLLGYLPRVLAKRPEFRLIITSATLDAEAVAAVYDDCVVHTIEGRGFPIELRYRPPSSWADEQPAAVTADDDDDELLDLGEQVAAAVAELDRGGAADILVFLPGEREIREVATVLERARLPNTELLRLYARLGAAQQARVFAPGSQRRIVLATNVAETSLTVPRIRHVIDSGLARVSRYSPRRKLQQLPIEPIPRANAEQRAGRCGREAPGVCIRLYGEDEFNRRRRTIEPEILRTNLADVILRLKSLHAGEVEDFPFVQAPASRLIKDGYAALQEIGALDGARELTPLGAELSRYPIDPRLSRMLLAAAQEGALRELLIIVAALSISDPRERPHEARDAADRAHGAFADKRSDFLWFVRAFDYARELAELPAAKRRRACRRRFLAPARILEWVQLHDYLRERVTADGLTPNTEAAGYKAVHRAIAVGFPTQLAEWQQDRYHGCRGRNFVLHPSSVLYRRQVKWILAADIVETARPYARLAARFEPVWMEQLAPHLVRYSHEAPFWDVRRGCGRVTEIVRLLGLVIHGGREVELARVDKAAARRLLIEHGLLGGQLGEEPDFLRANLDAVAAVHDLEARTRRRDLVATTDELVTFYDERLPSRIVTRRALRGWLRAEVNAADKLYMSEHDVTGGRVVDVPGYLFPDNIEIAGTQCPLVYRFEPEHEADGLTVRVPLWLLPQVELGRCDRLVPGMLSNKVEQLIRAMPKVWRRRFVPAAEFAMAVVERLPEVPGPFDAAVASVLSRIAGVTVPTAICSDSCLPGHLKMRFEVVDDAGELLAAGRDPAVLLNELSHPARAARAAIDWGVGGRARSQWVFGDLPQQVEARRGDFFAVAYPGLRVTDGEVEAAVFDSPGAAAAGHGAAVLQLLDAAAATERQWLAREYAADSELALLTVSFAHDGLPLNGTWAAALARRSTSAAGVRDAAAFQVLLEAFRRAVVPEVQAALRWMRPLLVRGQGLRLDAGEQPLATASRDDMRSQLAHLLGPSLAWRHGSETGSRYTNYLDALARRLERAASDPGKDLRKLALVAPLWQRFVAVVERGRLPWPALETVHRHFEEYRIHVFAPELKAATRVSETTLADELNAIEQA